jgi:eukaryotic-like serine/threonine-protein kinase
MPLNRVRPDAARVGPTVDYQSLQDQAQDGRIAVVAGSGPGETAVLAILLRRRLFFLSVLFAILFGIVALIYFGPPLVGRPYTPEGPLAFEIIRTSVFVITALLASILWIRSRWTLKQLRLIELLLFGTLSVFFLARGHLELWGQSTLAHAVELVAQDQRPLADHMVDHLNQAIYMPWAFLVIAYGIFIPNRWQRCALVVALMVMIPFVLRTAAYVGSGIPLDDWDQVAGTDGFFLLLTTVAISIYGSHRIEVLREEVLQARKLGQYQLIERLGSGGMGEVHLAEHVLLRRPCAIKLIRPDRAGDPQQRLRFEREVKATATLTHPNTVQIYDYGHAEDGTFYYVMEYLPGLTLEQLVERHGPLPPARAVHFLRQVCAALREAHSIGLIHRDIKPGNVMVCERGGLHDTAKLLDFGLVIPPAGNPESEKLTQEGAITGTPAYMSPEQAGGQDKIDARSDIYSVGALAYFLLTGQSPFAGRSGVKILAAHLYEAPAPLTAHRPDVPPDLETVVLKCLAKNPTDRFPNVRSLESALAESDKVRLWTEEEATHWWQLQSGSDARTGSSQRHEEAGRTNG